MLSKFCAVFHYQSKMIVGLRKDPAGSSILGTISHTVFHRSRRHVGSSDFPTRKRQQLESLLTKDAKLWNMVATTEYTDWQRPLSGVHSVMLEKLAHAGEGGGMHFHPLSVYLPSLTKLWCTLQLRGQIHSPDFYSTPICTLRWLLNLEVDSLL
jgi:hypothetical protein